MKSNAPKSGEFSGVEEEDSIERLTDLLQQDLEHLDPQYIHAPVAYPLIYVEEARELVELLQGREELSSPLHELGITPETYHTTLLAARLCEAIEAKWDAVVRRTRRASWSEVEKRGQHMREELIAASRYHLRHDAHMLHELDLVQEGEGAADLILDLDTLARFIRGRRRCFKHDPNFDADERADAARQMAHELREHLGDIPRDPQRETLRRKRNRAFSLLSFLLFEIRQAGLYKFWQDEEHVKYFGHALDRDQHMVLRGTQEEW